MKIIYFVPKCSRQCIYYNFQSFKYFFISENRTLKQYKALTKTRFTCTANKWILKIWPVNLLTLNIIKLLCLFMLYCISYSVKDTNSENNKRHNTVLLKLYQYRSKIHWQGNCWTYLVKLSEYDHFLNKRLLFICITHYCCEYSM